MALHCLSFGGSGPTQAQIFKLFEAWRRFVLNKRVGRASVAGLRKPLGAHHQPR